MPQDLVFTAHAIAAAGRIDEAVTLLSTAGNAGDAAALNALATWHLAGNIIPRDVPIARALLRRAAAAGHVDSTVLEASLAANGSGGSVDWPGALALLRGIARHEPYAAEQRDLLDAMKIDAKGNPRRSIPRERIGSDPDIWRCPALFSRAECVHVANAALDMLEPATVVDPATGRNVPNPVRTSHGAVIGPTRETLVVQALNRRIAAATGTDWRQGEALSVLRYTPGQEFRPHFDAITGAGNQRVMTVLVYLNDGFTGGATYFVHNGVRVMPRTGDAIIFGNVAPDGSIARNAQHAGEPVLQGVKWLATRWIRARAFSPWTGPDVAIG